MLECCRANRYNEKYTIPGLKKVFSLRASGQLVGLLKILEEKKGTKYSNWPDEDTWPLDVSVCVWQLLFGRAEKLATGLSLKG